MRPIRKQELEYLDQLIKNKFNDKKMALKSQYQLEIDRQSKNNLKKFISTLKFDKIMNDLEKAESEYNNFMATKQQKEMQLDKTRKDLIEKAQNELDKWKDLRGWKEKSESYNNKDISDLKSCEAVKSYLEWACNAETTNAFYKSEKGRLLKYLEEGIEDAKNSLYSGLSIQEVWQNIGGVFKQAQIEVRIPKAMTMQITK